MARYEFNNPFQVTPSAGQIHELLLTTAYADNVTGITVGDGKLIIETNIDLTPAQRTAAMNWLTSQPVIEASEWEAQKRAQEKAARISALNACTTVDDLKTWILGVINSGRL